jgi:hypothetical protein
MKTLSKVFLLLLFLYPPISAQSQAQGIKTVNGWGYLENPFHVVDSSKTESFFFTDHNSQVFANYGKTTYPTYWNLQITWKKDFPLSFTTPDTVFLDCKFLSGTNVEKIKAINVFIAVQNSNQYVFIGTIDKNKNIPLNSSWKTLSWDMNFVKKSGLNPFFGFMSHSK